jgi:predicted ATP-binding protein involved in virulence
MSWQKIEIESISLIMRSFQRLEKIVLKNFRRFSSFEMSFHPELTVIVGLNGQGKTSVLDAITIAYGTFVGAFDRGKSKHFIRSDGRYLRDGNGPESEQQFPVGVTTNTYGDDEDNGHSWSRELTGPKNRTTTKNTLPITYYGRMLQQGLRTNASVELPVVAYYGSGRLWQAHKNMERKSVLSESRTMGYEDCLSPASNFTQLQQWMAKATWANLQQQQVPGYDHSNISARLAGISRVVNQVLEVEGWSNFHFSVTHEELAMSHQEQGILPVSLLSDGVRSMVSLAADLAWRCTRLNGHWGSEAPQRTEGLVLIDEVDIHLHPAWQQRVIASLRGAFPKIQFIVTTHSPQVLTTLTKENIRVLICNEDESWTASEPSISPLAHESGDALAMIMGTHPRPEMSDIMPDLYAYEHLARAGRAESEEARQIKTRLDAIGYEFNEADQALFTFLAAKAEKSKAETP